MCKAFCYKKFDFNFETGELSLFYQFKENLFEEKIIFPNAPFNLSEEKRKALNQIFFLTHIAFGISYYKAFCPEKIEIQSGSLSKNEAHFFNKFYLEGLGEFAVRNNLNLQGKITFPFSENSAVSTYLIPLKKRFLVPIGGGKDSCVSIELLSKSQEEIAAISIGLPRPIKECIQKATIPSFAIKREISSLLIELNNQGTVYNGHVPITGMLAFVLWISALLYDYQFVAMSCESSANSGNLMQGELAINHQYSKSFDFEKDFYQITHSVTPSFLYFSLLRSFSELKIAELFAKLCEKYFSVFTSCNKAFKLDTTKRLDRWCGSCDKCRFVFLILAPFMDKKTLIQAVGCNPLNDLNNLEGYKELLGINGHKPFECVGEIEECRQAFQFLIKSNQYKDDLIIKELKNIIPENQKDFLNTFSSHQIPVELFHEISKFI
ncbi:MAG: hypothetical protein J6V53_00755 [Alphaproteobacteria bacterium]|nr:hypothetical protein [Alphaproteobacteria bacterium]